MIQYKKTKLRKALAGAIRNNRSNNVGMILNHMAQREEGHGATEVGYISLA